MTVFKTWWLVLWAVTAAILLTTLFLLPFKLWSLLTFVVFGTMEGVGVFVSGPYPPLTDVIRRFVPGWVTFAAIYALLAWAGARWFGWSHALGVGILFGLCGWLTFHFDSKYDS